MKKKLLSLLLVFSMILPGTASLAYWDLDYSHPLASGITHIDSFDDTYGSSIINGFPDGSFGPYGTFTREQVAKMLTEYIGRHYNNYYQMDYNPFWDLYSTRWSYYHIIDLASIGIINGYPDGSFRPDGAITRAELTQMLYSVQVYLYHDYYWHYGYNRNYNTNYVDLYDHWAQYPIETMASVVGTDFYVNTHVYFEPDAILTRLEAAYMISRVIYFNTNTLQYYPDKYAYYH